MGGLADKDMEEYFTCCGKSICGGCIHSFGKTGNNLMCPFCNSDRDKTEEEHVEDLMKRAEINDAGAMNVLTVILSPWTRGCAAGSDEVNGTVH